MSWSSKDSLCLLLMLLVQFREIISFFWCFFEYKSNTLKQSNKRRFSISFFCLCSGDIEMFFFLPKFVHLHGQQFNCVLEKFSFTISFFG